MPQSVIKSQDAISSRIASLPFLAGKITIKKINGGLTNTNYLVSDNSSNYLVRLGQGIAEHHVMRFNELTASRAAHAAGISPAVVYAGDEMLVLQFIKSRTLEAADVRQREMLEKIIVLIKRCHGEVAGHLRGPVLVFWVFHMLRDYGRTLIEAGSSYTSALPELADIALCLEAAAGPYDMVFAHNDLLAANFLDDGKRLWLIDWDYGGFNTPLFDLGGLASNNDFDQPLERFLLESYFEAPVDGNLWRRYQAMKTASLLRETMWSMIAEIKSGIDFDFAGYTARNMKKFRTSYDNFLQT